MEITKTISRMLPALSCRMYVTAPTRPLQKIFGKSKEEKEIDEACKKAKQTTDYVKEGAEKVKEASESLMKMKKDVSNTVSQTGDDIIQKFKEPLKEAVSNAWNGIENKVAEKIRDRVMENKQEDAKNNNNADNKSN